MHRESPLERLKRWVRRTNAATFWTFLFLFFLTLTPLRCGIYLVDKYVNPISNWLWSRGQPAAPATAATATPIPAPFIISLTAADLTGDYQSLLENQYITLVAVATDGRPAPVIEFPNLLVRRILNELDRPVQFNGGAPAKILLEVTPEQRDDVLLLLERGARLYFIAQERLLPTAIPLPTASPFPTPTYRPGEVALALPFSRIASPLDGLLPGAVVELLLVRQSAPPEAPPRFETQLFQVTLLEALDAGGAPVPPQAPEAWTLRVLAAPEQAAELAAALAQLESAYLWPAAPGSGAVSR